MIKAYGWAIAQCKRKTELSLADHYFERGVGSAKLARWRLALADFKGAMRLEPDDPTHWFVVALASIHAKELSDYREHCDELLRDTPQFSDPDRVARIVDSLLLHQESSQDWRAVASLFDPYLNGRDGRASLRVRYGALLYRAGDYEQAIQRLKKLTDSDETDAVAKIWLTLSLARAHRVDEARQLLANGVKGLRRKWLTAPWYIRLRDQYLLTEVPAELWDGPSPFDREE
jgi:tetratricopeptide (TPR) repeat protein